MPGNENDCDAELWIKNCYNSLNDDFNSPKLIAEFFNLYKNIQEIKSKSKSIDSANLKKFQEYFSIFYTDILGFDDEKSEKNQLDEVLDILLEIRDNERDKKKYEVSDLIRDKLSKLGININDKQ
jgi:cysteinyl-tRNA synthetase